MQCTDTIEAPAGQPKWAEALADHDRETAAYQAVARKYEAACKEYDDCNTPPDVLARYDKAEAEHDAACDKLWEARNKLLATPAPTIAAMMAKLELLSSIMAEHHVEDAPAVKSIRDDARRLLASA